MAATRADRRLAAILAADVVGYSRLIERDEAGTLERLKEHRKTFIEPLIAEHQGRIVKLMGDGALVRVRQRRRRRRSAPCHPARHGGARGGRSRRTSASASASASISATWSLEEGDIYGDGVNVAARLERLAEPGGIVISGTAYDQLQGKLRCGFQDLRRAAGQEHRAVGAGLQDRSPRARRNHGAARPCAGTAPTVAIAVARPCSWLRSVQAAPGGTGAGASWRRPRPRRRSPWSRCPRARSRSPCCRSRARAATPGRSASPMALPRT